MGYYLNTSATGILKQKCVILTITLILAVKTEIAQVTQPSFQGFQPGVTGNAMPVDLNSQPTQAGSLTNLQENSAAPRFFSPAYIPAKVNTDQNAVTQQMISVYTVLKEKNTEPKGRKQPWELTIKGFTFADPTSKSYVLKNPYYQNAYNTITGMLEGNKQPDLKQAVFLVENAYFDNKAEYKQFCELIEHKVFVLKQIMETEGLDTASNLALNYCIQKLFISPVKYKDKSNKIRTEEPFKYDFEDFEGNSDYTKQFVSKLLASGKGQCHSLPLLYLILADEIGAKANLAYSPAHSYITFTDDQNNWYNFECTSGEFTSCSFIAASGYVKSEAIKSGIYMQPVSPKQVIANQLNDLAIQHSIVFGTDDFQLKCAKRCLHYFPNDIMALMTVSNYQTAKAQIAAYYAGYPDPKKIDAYPSFKKELNKRNELYSYIDNLGFYTIPDEAYREWLKSLDLEKAKRESLEIKNYILQKIKM